MAAQFALRVFGQPQLVDGQGAPVRFRTKKHLALLTYLHFEGRGRSLSRDVLTELLWPDAPPEKGRHSLSEALAAIRAHLGAEALTRRGHEVRLLAELPSDLDRLCDGGVLSPTLPEPLLGIEESGGAAFSHWVDASRARIQARAREALRGALKAARSAGDLPRVHRLAALLHGIDALCADAVHALAERALLDGDTVAAVRLLKEQVRRAEAELGTNPNPEIVHLLRRLERGERPGHAAQVSGFSGAMTRREVFVGREAELARLEAMWERARGAGYQTGLVTGAPGIGKSSLIRRFATTLAARAWPAFVVPCQEIGQGIPYAAVAELITAMGRDPSAGGTDPLWLAEASRVCPGLKAIYPGIPEPPNAPTDSIRLRVAEAVLRIMEAVSDQGPLFVGFDDVQYMDPASREVLFLVTRRLDQVPTLILATSRQDSVAEVPSAESGRATLAWGETVALEPLGREQAMRLLDNLLGDDNDVDKRIRETIVRLAQGNPYFVELLLSDWRQHEATSLVAAEADGDRTVASWSPPETLRSAFERHYRGLSVDAQHLLQLLAVAERAMGTPEIASRLGIEVAAVERGVLEMLDHGIARVERGRVAFKNELHRAYVYYAIGEERRSYFHTRVADWLAERAGGDDFQRLLEACHHYINARMPAEASQAALAGAEHAVRRGAPGEAERTLRALLRAYPLDAGARVHLVLASALVAEGKYREAFEALQCWPAENASPSDRALAAQLKAEALHRGRLADDESILEAAVFAVSAGDAAGLDVLAIRALQVRAEVAGESGSTVDVEKAGAQAQSLADESLSPEARALATLTRGYCLLVAGRLSEASEAFATAAPLLNELGLMRDLRRALNGSGISNTGLGRIGQALRSFDQAIVVARKLGDREAACNVLTNAGASYQEAGFHDRASQCFRAAMDFLPRTSRSTAPLFAAAARLATETGDFSEAERYAADALSAARDTRSWRFIVSALAASADLHIARGEPERAWALVEESIALVGDRSPFLDGAGQYERLRRHFVWVTAGYESAAELEAPAQLGTLAHLPDRLQISAFAEWMDSQERGSHRETAAAEIVRTGLFGVLCQLLAVRIRFSSLPNPQAGESSAQLVARVFRPQERWRLPEVDALLQQRDV